MQAELDALEASAERAGLALACVYSSSEELVAADIRARRTAARWGRASIGPVRLVLVATALAAVGALAALALVI